MVVTRSSLPKVLEIGNPENMKVPDSADEGQWTRSREQVHDSGQVLRISFSLITIGSDRIKTRYTTKNVSVVNIGDVIRTGRLMIVLDIRRYLF